MHASSYGCIGYSNEKKPPSQCCFPTLIIFFFLVCTECAIADAGPQCKQLTMFSVNEHYGYLHPNGELALAPMYSSLDNFDEECRSRASINGKYGSINYTGAWIIHHEYDEFSFIRKDNLYAGVKKNNKFGVIDKDGKVVVDIKFEKSFYFTDDGWAVVSYQGKQGYIDVTGKWMISPRFEDARNFVKDRAWTQNYGNNYYINRSGGRHHDQELREPFSFSANGLASCSQYGTKKSGYQNRRGRTVIPMRFDYAENFSDKGIAVVRIGNYYGIIDGSGSWVLRPEYRSFIYFINGYDFARKETDKYDVLSDAGKVLLKSWVDDYKRIDSTTFWGKINDKWGISTIEGKWNLPPQFTILTSFRSDEYIACENNSCGVVDKKGTWLVKPFAESLESVSNGLSAAKSKGLFGYIDEKYEWAIDPVFEAAGSFSNEFAVVKQNGKFGMIDKQGNWFIKPEFDAMSSYNNRPLVEVSLDGNTGWAGKDGLVLYAAEVCGSYVLKNMHHYIVWPPPEQLKNICRQQNSNTETGKF